MNNMHFLLDGYIIQEKGLHHIIYLEDHLRSYTLQIMVHSYLENEIIFGDNVLNSEGDPLYKVYNTASMT